MYFKNRINAWKRIYDIKHTLKRMKPKIIEQTKCFVLFHPFTN